MTDWLTKWQTKWQTDRLIDKMIDKPTDTQNDRPTDRQNDRQTDWQTKWQTDRLTDKMTDRPTDRASKGLSGAGQSKRTSGELRSKWANEWPLFSRGLRDSISHCRSVGLSVCPSPVGLSVRRSVCPPFPFSAFSVSQMIRRRRKLGPRWIFFLLVDGETAKE